jgi:hypothetical protein
MTANPSPTVRLAVYIVGGAGSLIAAYLFGKGIIGQEESALWSGLVALAFGVAGLNVPTGSRRDDRGHVDLATALLVGVVALVVLALLGFFR